MPEYSSEIKAKLAIIESLPPARRRLAEVVAVYWPSGTVVYASAAYDELPNREGLAPALEEALGYTDPILVKLIPSRGEPLLSLPKTASVADDTIILTFSDLDGEFSAKLMTHGEGIRCEVFNFWNAQPEGDDPFDLFLSAWRGSLHAPSRYNRPEVKITAAVGFRSPQLQIPRQPNAVSCPFIFGAHLNSQEEIFYHQGCPYNAHLTEIERGGAPLIGVPGFTDCPRTSRAVCFARLTLPDSATQTENFWPGVETRPDPIPNNQTQGPNLLAYAIGNQSALGQPIRVIFGYRHVKALLLLAFRPEYNNNHPEDAFAAALFEVSKGPIRDLAGFRINDQIVGAEHQQQRLGTLGQTSTDWSPDVGSYSGTAIIWGRIQTDVLEMRVEDVTGSVYASGLDNIRLYSDEETFAQTWTANRMWCLLEMYCNPQWGYGVDYSRVLIDSAIDTAAWCDEVVAMQDPNGNVFGGVRSTFSAELTARATHQQIKDTCTAGRIGVPFEWNGKDVFVPLRTESLEGVPEFTDEGPDRNIIYDGPNSSLEWSQISDAELTNQWTVNYDDSTGGQFIDTQLIFGDQIQQLRAGRAWGDRSRRVINKNQPALGITNFLEAARFGNTLLYLGPLDTGGIANNLKVKFTTWYSSCFNVRPYKLIRVLNSKLQASIHLYSSSRGFAWYAGTPYSYFRVMKIDRKGDLRVEIEAQLYPQDYYASLDGEAGECDEVIALVDTSWVELSDTLPGFSGLADGDWLFVWAYYVSNIQDADTPAGWEFVATARTELLPSFPGVFTGVNCYRRKVTNALTEAISYEFASAVHIIGGAWRGVHAASPVQATATNSYHDIDFRVETFPLPSVTTLTAGARVVAGIAHSSRPAGEPESWRIFETIPDYTKDANQDNNYLQIYHLDMSAAGPTGEKIVTLESVAGFDSTAFYHNIVLALTPACLGGLPSIPPQPTEPGDPELELGQEAFAGTLGPEVRIHGTVTFPTFHLPLRADIFVTPPGGIETLIEDNIAPLTGSVTAQFTYTPTAGGGEYCFRVTVETAEVTPTAGGEVTECITITVIAEVYDVDLSPALDVDLSTVFDV